MRLFYYLFDSIFIYIYILSLDYFYYAIYKKQYIKYNQSITYILIIQFILCLFLPPTKETNSFLSSFLFYITFLMGLFCYKDYFKNKAIYCITTIAIGSCIEMFISSIVILCLNIIGNYKYTFTDNIFQENPIYFCAYALLMAVFSIILVRYIYNMIKNTSSNQIKKLLLICFLPLALMVQAFSFLYVSFISGKAFYLMSLIDFLIIVIVLIVVHLGIKSYLLDQRKNRKLRQDKLITEVQIEQMKSIDQYYQEIRRKNHDFKNHSLVILEMFYQNDKNVKKYIKSLSKMYDKI